MGLQVQAVMSVHSHVFWLKLLKENDTSQAWHEETITHKTIHPKIQ